MIITHDVGGYLAIALLALVAHESWRWLGAFLGRRVTEADDVFVWVRYVASALVAALAMRLIFFPAGVLAEIAFSARLAATIIGVGVFLATKRNLALGIGGGSLSLVGLGYLASLN